MNKILNIILFIIGWLLLNVLFMVVFQVPFESKELPNRVFSHFINSISTIVCVFLFVKYQKLDDSFYTILKYKIPNFLQGVLIGILLLSIIIGVILFFSKSYLLQINHLSYSEIFLCINLFLLVGLIEEFIFRFYIIGIVLRDDNKFWVLILSSLIFMVFHAFNEGINLLAFINLFLSGYLLGLVFIKYGFWSCVGLHFSWNYVQSILGLPVSGTPLNSPIKLSFSAHELMSGNTFGVESSVITSVILLLATAFFYRKS